MVAHQLRATMIKNKYGFEKEGCSTSNSSSLHGMQGTQLHDRKESA